MDVLFQKLSLPDLWQQEAVRSLRQGHDVIVDAPTGAGKTRVFELLVKDPSWRKPGRQAVFTVPTRALANDKWAQWREEGWDVGIATGDLAVNTEAPVIVATLETQRERFLKGQGPAILVVDEYQMISDPTRGLHYELALALAPARTQLLLLSGSVGNPERIASWLRTLGRQVELVVARERPVPLDDVHLLGLPHQAPKAVKGFWPRLAAEVLLADMGPLLIFVPHRKGAAKVARQIADALPAHEPISLTTAQSQLAGKELQRMLTKRVCYHHSGLHYELRAGLLEPLARAGHLRVIVATMGLAAGINFSVRSVFVAESTYHDGPFLHQLQPDELLQMFGRAGRRGKDTIGYVIHGDKNPRLADARPRDLRRANEIDWPTLLRIMHGAASRGEDPYAAAIQFCRQLFSKQPILLGIESQHPSPTTGPQPQPKSNRDFPTPSSQNTHRHFGLGPSRREVLNSQGEWEPYDKHRLGTSTLGHALVRRNTSWTPARRDFEMVAKRTRLGQAKRREDTATPALGSFLVKEIVVATRPHSESPWRPPKTLAKLLPPPLRRPFDDEHAPPPSLLSAIEPLLEGGRLIDVRKDPVQIVGTADFRHLPVDAYRDHHDAWLIDPPRRVLDLQPETAIVSSSQTVQPQRDSPVHAWRSLGLIEADGTPTQRGIIFSFFYHGEGLAIAAALETPDYPIDDLLWHLANLRSGHRFRSLEGTDDERLTLACRHTYGPVNHPGYLRLGVPLQYGEGAAEAVRARFHGGGKRLLLDDELGRGDVERAVHEWVSLLRQISHAPSHPWDRWQALQSEAANLLGEIAPQIRTFGALESSLTRTQGEPFSRHRLHLSDFRSSGSFSSSRDGLP